MKIRFRFIALVAVIAIGASWLFLYIFCSGLLLHRALGHSGWPEMASDDFRMSPVMRLALRDPVPTVTPGPMTWQTLAPGYEVAELPVMMGDREVDRFLLNRIDPRRYTFSVQTQSAQKWTIDDWEHYLPSAALIVNGSFFAAGRGPDTPVLSNGIAMGPQNYDAKAGAFVTGESISGSAAVVDLGDGAGWQKAFAGAHDAMVAYPLLIGADGLSHVTRKSRWLANRTFVAEDRAGRIIVGSTHLAFFSLDREAEFLRAAPLDIKTALNLDGGPVACQSVRVGTFHRRHIAQWEAQVEGDRVHLLNQGGFPSDMPIVLVATPLSYTNGHEG